MISNFIDFIISLVSEWGYIGIFLMMFLESSFVPFPSEVAMIPAGYLVYKGEMNFIIAFLSGVLGSIAGAIFNYYLCCFFGREFIKKYGNFIGVTNEKFIKFQAFFDKYGEISIFNSRLIPGIRQYISLPAGLAKMNINKFIFYTALGSALWILVLMCLGYFIGENETVIKEQLHIITIITLFCIAVITFVYIKFHKKS